MARLHSPKRSLRQLLVPLFVVRYEAVIGSFLGETSGRLKRLFDFVRTHQCVLFFDEFDTLGKERGDVPRNRGNQACCQFAPASDRRFA